METFPTKWLLDWIPVECIPVMSCQEMMHIEFSLVLRIAALHTLGSWNIISHQLLGLHCGFSFLSSYWTLSLALPVVKGWPSLIHSIHPFDQYSLVSVMCPGTTTEMMCQFWLPQNSQAAGATGVQRQHNVITTTLGIWLMGAGRKGALLRLVQGHSGKTSPNEPVV